jgi:hypothetical protein
MYGRGPNLDEAKGVGKARTVGSTDLDRNDETFWVGVAVLGSV